MIYLYSGTPGSGKSLHVAQIIKNRCRSNLPTISNFDINADRVKHYKTAFYYVENENLTPDDLREFSYEYFTLHRHKFSEDGILLVIDEAQLLFNCREWDGKKRADWISFFTQHRKMGFKVILIAQFDRMLDRQIRSLLEYEYIHRKVSNFGVMGRLLSAVTFGKLHVCVKIWYPLHERIGSEFFKARKSLYGIYDSYGTFKKV